MTKLLPADRRTRIIVIWTVLVAVVVGGYFSARYLAWPAVKSWREARLNRMAEEFLAQGNYTDALLTARKNLKKNQRNLETWRLAYRIAEAKDSPEAVYYLDHVVKAGKKLPDRIAFIKLAMRHGYMRHAIEAVEGAGEEARDSAEFHQIAAEALQRANRAVAAKVHLYSLVQLRPDDHEAQLALAEAEFRDDVARPNLDLRRRIADIANDPELRVRALTLLVDDAVTRKDAQAATRFAEQLERETLEPAQALRVLDAYELADSSRLASYRDVLAKRFATDESGAAAWLRRELGLGHLTEARTWYRALPEDTQKKPAVAHAMADILLTVADWPALRQLLERSDWADEDYRRQAYLAYVARATGRPVEAQDAWKFAALKAGNKLPQLADLVARASQWGWNDQAAELLWKVFNLLPQNESVRDQLIAWERLQGNTSNLNRLFAKLLEADPDNLQAKNNLAYTSLLLGSNLTRAYAIARELYKEDPKNPFFATTQALALLRQGKYAEGLEVIESIGPVALAQPERAVLRARLRASAEPSENVADLVAGIPQRRLLPEERALARGAITEIARADKAAGAGRLLNERRADNEAHGRHGWTALLPADAVDLENPKVLAADTLFAAGDFAGLGQSLRSGAWGGSQEHLRLALLAFVGRQDGDLTASKNSWRAALATAGSDTTKLTALTTLAQAWEWRDEYFEAVDRRFARNAADTKALGELLQYYRAAGRTADMARVLSTHLQSQPGTPDQWSRFAYYSMLCNLNLSRAYVAAQKAYQAAPDQPGNRAIYAFALWKQRQFDAAWELLANAQPTGEGVAPRPLLEAMILADLQRAADASQRLKNYQAQDALPEEETLAATLRRKLAERENSSLSAL